MTKSPYLGPLCILTTLFFMWGFITCLNDILIPQLKSVFILNYTQVMLVQFCFFAAYFLVSVPSGYFVARFNYKVGIVTGLSVASLGCLLFYPAAALLSYALFLLAFFILASGITLLQVAANPYVTLLGEPETASSRLNLTQAFNSLGTTLAPFVGSLFILATPITPPEVLSTFNAEALLSYQNTQASAVQIPYLILASTLLLLALLFIIVRLPHPQPTNVTAENFSAANDQPSAWHYRHLVLGALGIFLYVGAEVSIGSFLISYLGEPEIAGLSAQAAGKYVSIYWGGAMMGRFIGASLMQRIAAGTILSFNATIATILVVLTILGSGSFAMWAILAIGLFNSIMFPTIFSLALNSLGDHTGQGSGILCSAIVGGAILPVLQGFLADQFGIHNAFLLPALCYCYIAYYGYWGSRVQSRS